MQESFLTDSITMVGTIMASVVAAYALIRTSSIDYQDKVYRSLWVFEQYLVCLGKLIANQSLENKENYKAAYLASYFYMEEDIKYIVQDINECVEEGNLREAEEKTLKLADIFSKKYDMKRFYLKNKVKRK